MTTIPLGRLGLAGSFPALATGLEFGGEAPRFTEAERSGFYEEKNMTIETIATNTAAMITNGK